MKGSADEPLEEKRVMIDHQSLLYERLSRPLYSFAEADRLAGVTRGTSSRWLKGYHYWLPLSPRHWLLSVEERRTSPPVTPRPVVQEGVSFVDLIEVVAIGRLRDEGFSVKRIRQINEYCQLALNTRRPLVTEKFKTNGRDVFVMAGNGFLLNVLHEAGAQAWDEVLDPLLETLDYEEELARRWWPGGRESGVVVDPDYGYGLPVIDGSGVRTEIIAERHRAGDTKKEIAYDFGVEVPQVEAALRYELPEAA